MSLLTVLVFVCSVLVVLVAATASVLLCCSYCSSSKRLQVQQAFEPTNNLPTSTLLQQVTTNNLQPTLFDTFF